MFTAWGYKKLILFRPESKEIINEFEFFCVLKNNNGFQFSSMFLDTIGCCFNISGMKTNMQKHHKISNCNSIILTIFFIFQYFYPMQFRVLPTSSHIFYRGKVRPSQGEHRNFIIAVLSSRFYHRNFIITVLSWQWLFNAVI